MKMSKFKYPIDTDQFQKIREQGMLCVDKTDMMYDLADRYGYVFLARPRRFASHCSVTPSRPTLYLTSLMAEMLQNAEPAYQANSEIFPSGESAMPRVMSLKGKLS